MKVNQKEYDLKTLELDVRREEIRCRIIEHHACIGSLEWDVARLDLEATKLRIEMTKQLMEEERT